jgi:hypothetical protein
VDDIEVYAVMRGVELMFLYAREPDANWRRARLIENLRHGRPGGKRITVVPVPILVRDIPTPLTVVEWFEDYPDSIDPMVQGPIVEGPEVAEEM